ncbi:hypothetical protein [Ammoniphilus sp. YIM 78166]|uniref:hypothetical protein n=1 Tax=Ammoniphilus sp. YIM 78166 TaxID=1644106 RepID=UPI00142FDC5E|nr:hypothetical protein [Ammoniphilus sp. YIM 78166]
MELYQVWEQTASFREHRPPFREQNQIFVTKRTRTPVIGSKDGQDHKKSGIT